MKFDAVEFYTFKKMIFRKLTIVFYLYANLLAAQTSTFDNSNEGWAATGDPTSTSPFWEPSGGNPDGYIRVTDAAIGGTWYFEADSRYKGNKCDAYGRFLRWDQFTSDTTAQQPFGGNPDVVLQGNSLTLVFDNAQNPTLEWTHYDILLREDAGWRLGNINGPIPTQAQFQSVLTTLSAIRIRGEYRAQADFGGLDNFILESSFQFDLDGDDSSGETAGGFIADTTCTPSAFIADADALLFSERPIDSVVLRLPFAQNPVFENLTAGVLPPGISAQQNTPGWLTLVNTGGASAADFVQAIKNIQYQDLSPNPARGQRIVLVRIFSECGEMAQRYAYLPVFPVGDAGMDAEIMLCPGDTATDLFDALHGSPQPGGFWQPALKSGSGQFLPGVDPAGVYRYILPDAGPCPGDTARVVVRVEKQASLRKDTTVCFGEVLEVLIPPYLIFWTWSDGSQNTVLEVDTPGTYLITGLTENCPYTDSVRIDFFTCKKCPFYAPNVFRPGGNEPNDRWQIFLGCAWEDFRLEIFDRWGNQVFTAADPQQTWDGAWRGQPAPPGVYGWYASWQGELRGKPERYKKSGSVTVLR